MATTEIDRRQWQWIAIGIVLLVLIGFLVRYLYSPPQMGANEEVFKTVDALFTAINSHSLNRIEDCEHRLHTLRDQKALPSSASKQLDAIIQQSRAGQWKPAAQRLYDFMLAQQRKT